MSLRNAQNLYKATNMIESHSFQTDWIFLQSYAVWSILAFIPASLCSSLRRSAGDMLCLLRSNLSIACWYRAFIQTRFNEIGHGHGT